MLFFMQVVVGCSVKIIVFYVIKVLCAYRKIILVTTSR